LQILRTVSKPFLTVTVVVPEKRWSPPDSIPNEIIWP
jgi:hypothetical protein